MEKKYHWLPKTVWQSNCWTTKHIPFDSSCTRYVLKFLCVLFCGFVSKFYSKMQRSLNQIRLIHAWYTISEQFQFNGSNRICVKIQFDLIFFPLHVSLSLLVCLSFSSPPKINSKRIIIANDLVAKTKTNRLHIHLHLYCSECSKILLCMCQCGFFQRLFTTNLIIQIDKVRCAQHRLWYTTWTRPFH